MIIARSGAVVFALSLGVFSAADAGEPPSTTAGRALGPRSIEASAPTGMLRLAAETRTAPARTQLRSRTVQQVRTPAGAEDRVAKLEQRVAELEAQVGQLLSILEVSGQDVAIRGRRVRIDGEASLDLRAPQTSVESQSALQLKAPIIKLNGGSKPIARVGSPVAGGVVSDGAATVLAP